MSLLATAPASEIRKRIVSGEVLARDVVSACLARIERFNSALNAMVTLNERDFWPPPTEITIARPAELIVALREWVASQGASSRRLRPAGRTSPDRVPAAGRTPR